jgi:hypothetical protein
MTRAVCQYFALAAWALWMGGFAFYFSVVVPTGGEVIGGSEQGFVTQWVTSRLNWIGVGALAILLFHAVHTRSRLLLTSWAILAVLHAALFSMHPQLDALIDASAHAVTNADRFHTWHEWYETAATVQWLVGMVHLAFIVRAASRVQNDRPGKTLSQDLDS